MANPQPRSSRLSFRPLGAQELDVFHTLVCDPHVRRYLLDGQCKSRDWSAEAIDRVQSEAARSGLGLWLLFEHDSAPTPLGFAGFLRLDGPGSPLELVYALTQAHTGRGLARASALALIDFARAHCGQHDIVASVDAPNLASQRVLTRLGFACTGQVPGAFGAMYQYRLVHGRPPLERSTARLVLRPFRDSDLEPFARLNADTRVMEHFPAPLSRQESDAMVARIGSHFASTGFGLWALELPGVAPFIGFTGLSVPRFESHFTPCVEVGWRLAPEHWGQGYASEAARAALETAFVHLGLDEVVSFTAVENLRSRRVMERVGMRHDAAGDFEHPGVPHGHKLRRHVLYRLSRACWAQRHAE